MKPKRLAVIDAFVSVIAGCRSIKGAAHDVPFEYEGKKYPFAFIYDSDEEYSFDGAPNFNEVTLSLESTTVFEFSEQRGKTPRVLGAAILAEQLAAVMQNFRLDGLALDVTPTSSAIGEVATKDGSDLAATVVTWRVRYTCPLTDPYMQEV